MKHTTKLIVLTDREETIAIIKAGGGSVVWGDVPDRLQKTVRELISEGVVEESAATPILYTLIGATQ